MEHRPISSPASTLIAPLLAVVAVPLLLLAGRILYTDSSRYVFMFWNTLLAVIPLLLVVWLLLRLRHKRWRAWPQLSLTALWLLFLPNSFYLMTDLIHIRRTFEISLLYDAVMFGSFMVAGFALGFASLALVHRRMLRVMSNSRVRIVILGVLLASSFAIFLGRYSRWNTWDVVFAPAGLLFDVSERVVNPAAHLETYVVTGLFFVVLTPLYWLVWRLFKLISA